MLDLGGFGLADVQVFALIVLWQGHGTLREPG